MFEDKCLNMNRVAWQFYQYVSVIEPSELFYDGDEPDHRYTFKAKPYFNCRERGFVFEIWNTIKPLGCIAFYEHRNSDAFMGLFFVPDGTRFYYTPDDIPEQYFPDKDAGERFGDYGYPDFEKAVDFIRESFHLVANQKEISDKLYDAYREGLAEAGQVA